MRTRWLTKLAGAVLLASCARSPTGTPQLRLVGDDTMAKMGISAFDEIKEETPQTRNDALTRYVQCVAGAVSREAAPEIDWDVVVFESKEVNAFALPGGKIGVYTGILEVAEGQDQLAAIVAHEVGHVTAKHGNARVSAALAADAGLQLTSALVGRSSQSKQTLFGLIGAGTQVGVLMPYGRGQETEADVLGLDYMSKAGFDPQASVELWRNMQKVGGKNPPTFLSTHPSHEGRIQELTKRMAPAVKQYEAARQAGKAPRCQQGPDRSAEATAPSPR
jgi:predicted Zn-dependent protease